MSICLTLTLLEYARSHGLAIDHTSFDVFDNDDLFSLDNSLDLGDTLQKPALKFSKLECRESISCPRWAARYLSSLLIPEAPPWNELLPSHQPVLNNKVDLPVLTIDDVEYPLKCGEKERVEDLWENLPLEDVSNEKVTWPSFYADCAKRCDQRVRKETLNFQEGEFRFLQRVITTKLTREETEDLEDRSLLDISAKCSKVSTSAILPSVRNPEPHTQSPSSEQLRPRSNSTTQMAATPVPVDDAAIDEALDSRTTPRTPTKAQNLRREALEFEGVKLELIVKLPETPPANFCLRLEGPGSPLTAFEREKATLLEISQDFLKDMNDFKEKYHVQTPHDPVGSNETTTRVEGLDMASNDQVKDTLEQQTEEYSTLRFDQAALISSSSNSSQILDTSSGDGRSEDAQSNHPTRNSETPLDTQTIHSSNQLSLVRKVLHSYENESDGEDLTLADVVWPSNILRSIEEPGVTNEDVPLNLVTNTLDDSLQVDVSDFQDYSSNSGIGTPVDPALLVSEAPHIDQFQRPSLATHTQPSVMCIIPHTASLEIVSAGIYESNCLFEGEDVSQKDDGVYEAQHSETANFLRAYSMDMDGFEAHRSAMDIIPRMSSMDIDGQGPAMDPAPEFVDFESFVMDTDSQTCFVGNDFQSSPMDNNTHHVATNNNYTNQSFAMNNAPRAGFMPFNTQPLAARRVPQTALMQMNFQPSFMNPSTTTQTDFMAYQSAVNIAPQFGFMGDPCTANSTPQTGFMAYPPAMISAPQNSFMGDPSAMNTATQIGFMAYLPAVDSIPRTAFMAPSYSMDTATRSGFMTNAPAMDMAPLSAPTAIETRSGPQQRLKRSFGHIEGYNPSTTRNYVFEVANKAGLSQDLISANDGLSNFMATRPLSNKRPRATTTPRSFFPGNVDKGAPQALLIGEGSIARPMPTNEIHDVTRSMLDSLSFPVTNQPLQMVASHTLARSHPGIIGAIMSFAPSTKIIERDYSLRKFDRATATAQYVTDADLVVSPSTGILLTNLTAIQQGSLPGGFNAMSLINSRIANVASRYERLYVLVSTTAPLESLNQGACLALSNLTAFCSSLTETSTVVTTFVPSNSNKILTSFILGIAAENIAPLTPSPVACHMTEQETDWEIFLRTAGMNTLAAQLVLWMLKCGHHVAAAAEGVEVRLGLPGILDMSQEERETLFEGYLGGVRVLRRVGALLDGELGRQMYD